MFTMPLLFVCSSCFITLSPQLRASNERRSQAGRQASKLSMPKANNEHQNRTRIHKVHEPATSGCEQRLGLLSLRGDHISEEVAVEL